MKTINDVDKIIQKYERIKDSRLKRLLDFHNGNFPYLIAIDKPCSFYTNCRTIEDSFRSNLQDFEDALELSSDSLPFLEPWFGTGSYAQAFGSPYFWRDNESPACHYKYKKINEVADITKPTVKQGEIFKLIIDAISYFRNQTNSKLPICISDTQSAHDTATLILDAVEVFEASYTNPDILHSFLAKINQLIIEFTRLQFLAIGNCLAVPGHIMASSYVGGNGFSISDDNLAVSSPQVSEKFLIPYDELLGNEFGGLAIHSCGNWTHAMPLVSKMKSVKMIDCAISPEVDPNPNTPELVKKIFKNTNIIVQVRIGQNVDQEIKFVERVWDKDVRLVVKIAGDANNSLHQYQLVDSCLKNMYKL